MRFFRRVYIQIDADVEPAVTAATAALQAMAADWNRQSDDVVFPDSIIKTLLLPEGGDKYTRLREFFLRRVAELPPGWLFWVETREAKYEKSDLLAARAVTVNTWHELSTSERRYGSAYETHVCPTCDTLVIDRQLRNLVANVGRLSSDFATTDFGEFLVSDKVRQILLQLGEVGASFRPVEPPSQKPTHKSYFQLEVARVVRPAFDSYRIFRGFCETCSSPIWREESRTLTIEEANAIRYGTKIDPWTFTSTNGPGPWSEMRLPESAVDGWDVARTDRLFGLTVYRGKREPFYFMLFASPRVVGAFMEAKLRGARYQPVTVVP